MHRERPQQDRRAASSFGVVHATRADGPAAPDWGGAAEASRAATLAADADAEVARSMLSMGAVAPRKATGAL